MQSQLEQQLLNFIEQNSLFTNTSRLLVAVSGGADSLSLLNMLKTLGFNCSVAHCNFNLRGTESDSEEKFVEFFCKSNNIKFYSKSFDTKGFALKNSMSIEMSARFLRYEWFKELVLQYSFDNVVVAHNRNDVVETFFLNIVRGTGLKGLTGIKAKNGKIVRPLLFADRSEIEQYCNEQCLDFRHDSSNDLMDYDRNKVRLKLLPQMREMNLNLEQTILKNIAILEKSYSVYSKEIERQKKSIKSTNKDLIFIDIAKLKKNKDAEILIYELINEFGFNLSQAECIYKSLYTKEVGLNFYSKNYWLVKDRKDLIIIKIEKKDLQHFEINKNSKGVINPIKMNIEVVENITKSEIQNNSKNIAYLDYEKLEENLTIRKRREGDYFYPFGMKGKKKIQDFFINQKLSLIEKDKKWLLLSGNDIVWVIGMRIDERYKINENTKKILILSYYER